MAWDSFEVDIVKPTEEAHLATLVISLVSRYYNYIVRVDKYRDRPLRYSMKLFRYVDA